MDDQRLRQQYEETGGLLDVLQDPEVLRKVIEAEDACRAAIADELNSSKVSTLLNQECLCYV